MYKMCVIILSLRFLQENRVACEMGLYYVLHIAKLRNKNALLRLLPALGENTLTLALPYIAFLLRTDCDFCSAVVSCLN